MDFVTNTATNPERSERPSTVTPDETPASHSEQSHKRRLARIRARRRECLKSETVEERETRLATRQIEFAGGSIRLQRLLKREKYAYPDAELNTEPGILRSLHKPERNGFSM